MLDTYVVQKAHYDEYWACMASNEDWDWPQDDWLPGEEDANDDDGEYSIDGWYAYWASAPKENPPTNEPSLFLENPLAP